jgi:hypothetical protein
VNAVAWELDGLLARLEPKAAELLATRVREEMARINKQDELPTLDEIKRRVPDIAHLIGAWGDEDPEGPEELTMPPAKTW